MVHPHTTFQCECPLPHKSCQLQLLEWKFYNAKWFTVEISLMIDFYLTVDSPYHGTVPLVHGIWEILNRPKKCCFKLQSSLRCFVKTKHLTWMANIKRSIKLKRNPPPTILGKRIQILTGTWSNHRFYLDDPFDPVFQAFCSLQLLLAGWLSLYGLHLFLQCDQSS